MSGSPTSPSDSAGSSRAFRLVAGAIAITAFVMFAVGSWIISLGPLPLAQTRDVSTTIVDRNGKLLRAYAMADGRWWSATAAGF